MDLDSEPDPDLVRSKTFDRIRKKSFWIQYGDRSGNKDIDQAVQCGDRSGNKDIDQAVQCGDRSGNKDQAV